MAGAEQARRTLDTLTTIANGVVKGPNETYQSDVTAFNRHVLATSAMAYNLYVHNPVRPLFEAVGRALEGGRTTTVNLLRPLYSAYLLESPQPSNQENSVTAARVFNHRLFEAMEESGLAERPTVTQGNVVVRRTGLGFSLRQEVFRDRNPDVRDIRYRTRTYVVPDATK